MNWFVIANSLSEDLSQYSVRVLVGGIVAVTVVLALASGLHHRYHFTKKAFYSVLMCIILAVTTALAVINIKLVTSSDDGAIAHLEGRISVFACGQEVSILPSNSLLNQSSGDSRHRIYPNGNLEFLGYRTEPETDGSLGSFFNAIGGSISSNIVALPFNDATAKSIASHTALSKFVKQNPLGEKYLELRSGESCGATPSMVNVFVYGYNSGTHSFVQERILKSPEQFLLTDKPFDEPDCIVIVYGEPDTQTNLTCRGYPEASKIVKDQLEGGK